MTQDLYSLHDLTEEFRDIYPVEPRKVVDEPIEVIEDFWGEFNLRHPACLVSKLSRNRPARFLASSTSSQILLRTLPGHRLPGRQDLRPSLVSDAMKLFLCLDLFDGLCNCIDDEGMSSFPCSVRRSRDTIFQIVINANGSCRH